MSGPGAVVDTQVRLGRAVQLHVPGGDAVYAAARQIRSAQVGANHARFAQVVAGEIRTREAGLSEVGALERDSAEIKPFEPRLMEVRPAQVGALELRTGQSRMGQGRVAEVCSCEIRIVDHRHRDLRALELRAGEVRLSQPGDCQEGSHHQGSFEVDAGEVDVPRAFLRARVFGKLAPRLPRPVDSQWRQIRAHELRLDLRVRLAPGVPRRHTSEKNPQVLGVGLPLVRMTEDHGDLASQPTCSFRALNIGPTEIEPAL